jgi:NAD(P)-dependent dehydrogenase (short-subunit alcohol dehydrogenase family)
MKLEKKVVVVTGAGSGMGRELVLGLGSAEAAAKIYPADKAAADILDGVERNRFRVLVGNDAKFLDVMYRLNPQRATAFIARMMKRYRP